MDFVLKHPKTGEIAIIVFSNRAIQNHLEDEIKDAHTCDCEPIGETNVVECNCEDYLCEFELQDRTD